MKLVQGQTFVAARLRLPDDHLDAYLVLRLPEVPVTVSVYLPLADPGLVPVLWPLPPVMLPPSETHGNSGRRRFPWLATRDFL